MCVGVCANCNDFEKRTDADYFCERKKNSPLVYTTVKTVSKKYTSKQALTQTLAKQTHDSYKGL